MKKASIVFSRLQRCTLPCFGVLVALLIATDALAQHGLTQTWLLGRANSLDEAQDFLENDEPLVEPFIADHGMDWWFGHQFEEDGPGGQLVDLLDECDTRGLDCAPYPTAIAPDGLGDDSVVELTIEGNTSFRDYTVFAEGEVFFPQSGTYAFTDGIDDYTYWAVDLDRSGTAGDSDDEVLIDDNNWTDIDRDRGTLDLPGEADITVAAGGEWLAVEFYMSEGGGHDAGIIYWNYDVANNTFVDPDGFDDVADDLIPLDQTQIPDLWIPQSHTRSGPTGGGEVTTVISEGIDTTLATGLNGPDGTHGAAGSNPEGEQWEWDGSDAGGENNGLLWFDIPQDVLSSFGDGQATLALHIANNGNAGEMYRMTSDWLSGPDGGDEVTFNNVPDGPGVVPGQNAEADSNATFPDSLGMAGQVLEVDVSEDVKAWAAGAANYGWGFVGAGGDGTGITSFENTSNPVPTLTLVYTSGGGAALQAGDADQDLDFDQLDLVKVLSANTYLTGNPATWGGGDWNGAPGGSQGSPPAGDGLFDQADIIAALGPAHYLTGPYAALAGPGEPGDDQTSLVYDPTTGELSIDPAAGKELTSINVTSEGGKFIGDKPAALDGAFDNFAADNVFKATFGGMFGAISFGNVLPAGLSAAEVTADLSAVGSLAGGGDLGAVDLVYIPEPSAIVLLCLGLAGALSMRRRRR